MDSTRHSTPHDKGQGNRCSPANARVIFLVGFMASGKTTLGREVSRLCGLPFIDLDQAVEQRHGKSVARIFAESGEDTFRRLEAQELRYCASAGGSLIACGGGTPCHAGNMDYMLAHGTVVWLDAPVSRLVERLLIFGASRPLVAGKTEPELRELVQRMLQERHGYYSRSHAVFDSSRLETAREIAETAQKFISRFID